MPGTAIKAAKPKEKPCAWNRVCFCGGRKPDGTPYRFT